jgi:hypothetical protein
MFSTMSSIYKMFSIVLNFKNQWKIIYFLKKQWKKQTWTLAYILVLQTMSFPFSFIFWSRPIEFPSKMMACRCHFKNWLELISDPHLKALGPIYDSQLLRFLHFVGPSHLDPHLKCPLYISHSISLFTNIDMKKQINMCLFMPNELLETICKH